jgi:outer membrane protein assembly factor BamB
MSCEKKFAGNSERWRGEAENEGSRSVLHNVYLSSDDAMGIVGNGSSDSRTGTTGKGDSGCHRRRRWTDSPYEAPVTVLDAATGEIVQSYEGTEATDEIVYSQSILVLCVCRDSAEEARRRGEDVQESILAINADTGEVIWQKQAEGVLPLSLAIEGDRVFFHNHREIVSSNLKTGEELWRLPTQGAKGSRWAGAATLVAHDGLMFFTDPKKMLALSAENGRILWTGPGSKGPGIANPPDLFVANGLIWAGRSTEGRDPRTGVVKKTIELGNLISPGHHYRCYRSKASERYLLWPKRGVEFIDLESGNHMRHDWLRAPCKYGVIPCNGLLYVPPHQSGMMPNVVAL